MRRNIFLSLWLAIFHPHPKVSPSDLAPLTGAKWEGTLTYLDYTSGQKVSIPANLTVEQDKNDPSVWYFQQEYPKEPHANSRDTLRISLDKHFLGGKEVTTSKHLAQQTHKIVTEQVHEDGNTYRYTYLISPKKTTFIKEEKKGNDAAFFERNRYEYQRK